MQDRCVISIAGLDVPVDDATWSVNTDKSSPYSDAASPKFPPISAPRKPCSNFNGVCQYNPLSTKSGVLKNAYPLSAARLAWSGLHGEYNGNADDASNSNDLSGLTQPIQRVQVGAIAQNVFYHFAPTGAPVEAYIPNPLGLPLVNVTTPPVSYDEFVAWMPYHVPRAAAHTKVTLTSADTVAANELFVIDGQHSVGYDKFGKIAFNATVDSFGNPSAGSFRGRTWLTSCEGPPILNTVPPSAGCSTADTTPSTAGLRIEQRWTTADPSNADGSTGLCFFGPSTSTSQRLLQVRKECAGCVLDPPPLSPHPPSPMAGAPHACFV